MDVIVGNSGLEVSFQDFFEETEKCVHCGAVARIGFVAHEFDSESPFVCQAHDNEKHGDGMWLHDACSVAVYFCTKCLEPTAKYTQA